MASVALVEAEIVAGRELYLALRDDPALSVTATFWHFDVDACEWRLMIATPLVRTKGPKAAYRRIASIAKKHNQSGSVPLNRIVAIDSQHPTLIHLRKFMGHPTREPRNNSYSHCVFNGMLVEGLYLYQMDPLIVPPS